MILMKLGGVKGDSKLSGKSDWITLSSFGLNVAIKRDGGTASETRDPDAYTIDVSKSLDIGSVDLFYHAFRGEPVAKAEVHFMETVKETMKTYLRYTLEKPVIVSWNISGSEDDRPTESVTISYDTIRMEYTQIDPTGRSTATHDRGWDCVKWTPK